MNIRRAVFSLLIIALIAASYASAQTTEFTYQGSLKNNGVAANGSFDFEFALFDTPDINSGSQIGPSREKTNVQVVDGIFSVSLDFGNQFPGAARFLQIKVRPTGTSAYTTLSPRQPVNSSPHAVRSLTATQLNGISADQYIREGDGRLTDLRDPRPFSIHYIQNRSDRQGFSNFNIDTGTADRFNALQSYDFGGNRLIRIGNKGNIYFGFNSGDAENGSDGSTFVGHEAGRFNLQGSFNSFFGERAGRGNLLGFRNSFFGNKSGMANTDGNDNSFFGFESGLANTIGSGNVFLGANAGNSNTTGSNNTLVGVNTQLLSPDLTFATGIGAGVQVSQSNSVVLGRNLDTVRIPGAMVTSGNATFSGNVNITGTLTAGSLTVPATSITGVLPIANGGTGLGSTGAAGNFLRSNGTIWESSAIQVGDVPAGSSFYIQNTTTQQPGNFNIAGNGTVGGTLSAGTINAASQYNFNGNRALSLTGTNNFFAGFGTGTTGSGNTFVGQNTGAANSTGTSNTFLGSGAGDANTTGSSNTVIGAGADVASGGLSFATAVGAGATVDSNNTVTLGRAADTVKVPGSLVVSGNTTAGSLNVNGNTSISGNLSVTGTFSVPATNITGVLSAANGGTGISSPGAAGNLLTSTGTGWQSQPLALTAAQIPAGSGNYIQNTTVQQTANFNISGSGTVGGNLTVSGNLNAQVPAANITGILGISRGGTGLSAVGPAGQVLRSNGSIWQSASLIASDIPDLGASYIRNGTSAQAGANFNISGSGTIGGNLTVNGSLLGSFTIPAANITGTLGTSNGGTGLASSGSLGNFLRSNGSVWTSSAIQASDIPNLSSSYIQNGTGLQTGNFNISGNGTIGGNLSVGGSITGNFNVSAANISGVLSTTQGGTGLNSAGATGNVLQSNAGVWVSQPLVLPPGSANYIQNTNTTQAGANFNIGGNGTIGGTLTAGTVNALNQFNLNGSRILASPGTNLFVGMNAGPSASGSNNTMVGENAGNSTTSGGDNVFLGYRAGFGNTTGTSNTVLGASANVGSSGLSFATAIGANAVVTASDTIVIGKQAGNYNGPRPADSVVMPGTLNVGGIVTLGSLGAAGSNNLCYNAMNQISPCSSSARYKSNINSFSSGLDIVRQLRPVSFNWKAGGLLDLGLVAEDVAKVEPLLVNRTPQGEVEGVKYDRVGVVLVNAVNEQQAQIESLRKEVEERKASEAVLKERLEKQQAEIDALKKLICSQNAGAPICQ